MLVVNGQVGMGGESSGGERGLCLIQFGGMRGVILLVVFDEHFFCKSGLVLCYRSSPSYKTLNATKSRKYNHSMHRLLYTKYTEINTNVGIDFPCNSR